MDASIIADYSTDIIAIVVFLLLGSVGIIGFLLNFLGRQALKKLDAIEQSLGKIHDDLKEDISEIRKHVNGIDKRVYVIEERCSLLSGK